MRIALGSAFLEGRREKVYFHPVTSAAAVELSFADSHICEDRT